MAVAWLLSLGLIGFVFMEEDENVCYVLHVVSACVMVTLVSSFLSNLLFLNGIEKKTFV